MAELEVANSQASCVDIQGVNKTAGPLKQDTPDEKEDNTVNETKDDIKPRWNKSLHESVTILLNAQWPRPV